MVLGHIITNMFGLDKFNESSVEWSTDTAPEGSTRVVVLQDDATSLAAFLSHAERAISSKIGLDYRPVRVKVEREVTNVATEWDIRVDYVKD